MFVRVHSGAVVGIDAVPVTVEVDITGGGLGLFLVGLPDSAVKESEQRIRAAFGNSDRRMSGRKIVVNLAPADLRKEGAGFDLPIAVGILAAQSEIRTDLLEGSMLAGELSLDGTVKPVRGVLPLADCARREGLRRIIVPAENAAEAAVVEGIEAIGVRSLREVADYLNGVLTIAPTAAALARTPGQSGLYAEDFADVKGQAHAKRALEIAAAGGHNVLMIGAPGSGKTMLARRLPTILPPLSGEEALETTKIHSVAGKPGAVHRYMGRISGPLLDRIDLHIEVVPVPVGELAADRPAESSAAIRARVVAARAVQAERFRGIGGVHTNAMMNPKMLREHCTLDSASRALLERAMERLSLSARAYDRILKVARTIADLAGEERIAAVHVAEAINYRSLDRESWGR